MMHKDTFKSFEHLTQAQRVAALEAERLRLFIKNWHANHCNASLGKGYAVVNGMTYAEIKAAHDSLDKTINAAPHLIPHMLPKAMMAQFADRGESLGIAGEVMHPVRHEFTDEEANSVAHHFSSIINEPYK